MSPPLTVRGVSKSFGSGTRQTRALDDVSFELAEARVTGLIGVDGAGKTTLMRLATGLLQPDDGSVSVLGHDLLREAETVQAAVGYMPQHFGLYEDLSVQENLDLYAALQGVAPGERQARYEELMRMTGLAPFMHRLAGRLSGGMKQKLGLACALIRAPRLLLLDEPTAGVDPVSRRELWQIVYGQVEQSGMSVLLSTAYLDEAERCHEILLMHGGKLLGRGAPEEFSAEVAGRSFVVGVGKQNKRRLQSQLADAPGILDAVITGDGVRVVTESAQEEGAVARAVEAADLPVLSIPARFEDAFIARLAGQGRGAHRSATLFGSSVKSTAERQDVIEVRNARRMFGDFCAVRDVSFTVRHGEVFGLLGANGAGKTTLFRMLCGLLPLSAGQATVAGADLRRARAQARSRIGYMAQKFSLYTNLSVGQNLEFYSSAYGLPRAQRHERVDWALETFELTASKRSRAGELPLGYQQRLALAAALMHRPEVLFLDEPTSGVDPIARRDFWRQINALVESGVTVLVTTHFLEEAEYCDRLVIMAEGAILAEGTPSDVKAAAQRAGAPSPNMEEAFISLIEQRDLPETGA
jgi:ABC-2 type transport system ATP-binding protein